MHRELIIKTPMPFSTKAKQPPKETKKKRKKGRKIVMICCESFESPEFINI